jgi:hypothetical protein
VIPKAALLEKRNATPAAYKVIYSKHCKICQLETLDLKKVATLPGIKV